MFYTVILQMPVLIHFASLERLLIVYSLVPASDDERRVSSNVLAVLEGDGGGCKEVLERLVVHPVADFLHTGKVKHGVAIFVHRLPVSSLAHKIQNNGQLEKKKIQNLLTE